MYNKVKKKRVGNQEVEGMPKETDAANTETVLITPPTGENREVASKILIAVGSLIILGSILLGIKERNKGKLF